MRYRITRSGIILIKGKVAFELQRIGSDEMVFEEHAQFYSNQPLLPLTLIAYIKNKMHVLPHIIHIKIIEGFLEEKYEQRNKSTKI